MSRFPDVLPPPDGLASAFRDATRRRTRTAAATGGAGLLACCLLLAAVTAGGTQTLSQQPVPPAQQVQPPALPGQLGETEPSAAPDEAERALPVLVRAAPRRGASASSPQPAPEADVQRGRSSPAAPRGAAGRTPEPRSPRHPVVRRNGSFTASSPDCAARSRPVCSRAYAGVQGSRTYLDLYLCNATTEAVTLRFAHLDEVDFEVRQGSRRHWRWSHGYPHEASAHTVAVGVAMCLVWNTTWPLVDQSGAPLPAGTYQLLATIDSADAGQASFARAEFTIR